MSVDKQNFSIFLRLGMTRQQTKVYITICRLGRTTAREIADSVQMQRAEVYRVLPKLQKLGLIKEIMTKPRAFKAIPPVDGLSILLERDAEIHKAAQFEAERFIRRFHYREKIIPEDNKYEITFGVRAEEREFLRNLKELKKSTDGIFSWNEFLYVFRKYFGEYKGVLERGVRIRRITNKPKNRETPQFIQKLQENGSFEIRSAPLVPKAGIDIFDKEMLSIVIIPNSGLKEIEVLRSRNQGVIELAQDYFELKWQSATALASS